MMVFYSDEPIAYKKSNNNNDGRRPKLCFVLQTTP